MPMAAERNIRKAQRKWQSMTHRQRALAQPQGRARAKPGTAGGGKYFRIVTRPKKDFVAFRTQDVGGPGHALRLAGKRRSGSWDTQAWLISKEEAHTQGDRLVPETAGAKKILKNLGSAPVHVKADIFQARPRRDIPESEKPTPAQRRAQVRNIRKAQAARRQHQKAA